MTVLTRRDKIVLGLSIGGIAVGLLYGGVFLSIAINSGGGNMFFLFVSIVFFIASIVGIILLVRWWRNISKVPPPLGEIRGLIDSFRYEPGSERSGRGNAWIFKLRRFDNQGNPTPSIWIKMIGRRMLGGALKDGDRLTRAEGKWDSGQAFFVAKKIFIDNSPNDRFRLWVK